MAQQYRLENPGYGQDFTHLDYSNVNNAFVDQFGFDTLAMDFVPQANTFNNQLSRMNLYSPTTMASSNNSNHGTNFPNFPPMTNAMTNMMAGHNYPNAFDFSNGQSGDGSNEQDFANSMPGDDVFFTQDEDYLMDS